MVTKTGSAVIVVSAKFWEEDRDFYTEHKPAGRKPCFYHSFNFDFLSKEAPWVPSLRLAASLLICPSNRSSTGSDTDQLDAVTTTHPTLRITTAMSESCPGGTDITGLKCGSVLSGQMLECDCGVERLFIDWVNKLQDAQRLRDWNKDKKRENSWMRWRRM